MSSANRQSRTVLVIEDSPLDAAILSNLIESHGGIAFVVSNYENALTVIDTLQFEAATLDLNLADDLNGADLIKRLNLERPDSKFRNKVVVFSGNKVSPEQVAALKSEGILDVLSKPFDSPRLVKLLNLNNEQVETA